MPTRDDIRVAFVVSDPGAGSAPGAAALARALQAHPGFAVVLVAAGGAGEGVLPLSEVREQSFDVALSTGWETTPALFALKATRYASFVAGIEDVDPAERFGARLALDLPVAFVTDLEVLHETLRSLRPDADCHLVRAGSDAARQAGSAPVRAPGEGPLRIRVAEGRGAAAAALALTTAPHELTAAGAQCDVVLAPDGEVRATAAVVREAMSAGAAAVAAETAVSRAFLRHGVNGLVCDSEDPRGTARQLDLLAQDRGLLERLSAGAVQTARAEPSWEDAAGDLAAALREIAGSPPPDANAAAARMAADLRAAVDTERRLALERRELERRLARLEALPVVRQARKLQASPKTRGLRRLAHPFTRRAKRGLLGE